ncbi:MAG: PAS domain-containing sensor histidine kinase [Ahrensia sp.]
MVAWSEQKSTGSVNERVLTTQSSGARNRLWLGIAVLVFGLVSAATTFFVLVGLTPLQPTVSVTNAAIIVNSIVVVALLTLIVLELRRIMRARNTRKAASRLHVRIVTFFSIIAATPALIVAIVAAITLDLGLDRWFELRTRSIIDSSRQVTEAYINENAINLRDATINTALALDQQRVLFSLDRTGFRQFLTQQARGRGFLGAFVMRPDGGVVLSADVRTARPLPLPPDDALSTAADGDPVIIPPGITNLVGAVIKLREIDDAFLYTVRTIDTDALEAVRLMEQNRDEYDNLEQNRSNIQIAFALLYFGLTLILLLGAIWSAIAVANRLVRPIRLLIGAADEVAGGNLEVRVPVRASDGDIGYLSETFNGMLGQLKTQRDEILDAKDQIDERRRFSEAVLTGVSAGVLGVDDQGCVTIANSSVSAVLDRPSAIVVGEPLSRLLPQLSEFFDDTQRIGRGDARRQIKFTDRTARERVLNIQIALDDGNQSVDNSGGNHITHVITIDDVTDLVEAQRSTAWADVARRIAHEIKNPLTPIQLSAERIRRRYGKVIADDDRAVFDQCTDTIIRQVNDIGRMVDEFSSFARMPKPDMQPGDLRETLNEATFLVEVSRSEITFIREFGEQPLRCHFDPRLIGQAVGNIIKNATEAIEARLADAAARSDTGKVWVRSAVAPDGKNVLIDIIDNGIGLPDQNRQKLLEPYMTTREKGTGLGLAIVRKIMEDHGGALELHDAPEDYDAGRGAMVRLVLPVFNNAPKQQKEPTHEREAE